MHPSPYFSTLTCVTQGIVLSRGLSPHSLPHHYVKITHSSWCTVWHRLTHFEIWVQKHTQNWPDFHPFLWFVLVHIFNSLHSSAPIMHILSLHPSVYIVEFGVWPFFPRDHTLMESLLLSLSLWERREGLWNPERVSGQSERASKQALASRQTQCLDCWGRVWR